MNARDLLSSWMVGVLMTACTSEVGLRNEVPLEPDDASGIAAAEDAEDAYGIRDGTAVASAMLRVVNEKTEEELRTQVGINATLSRNIVRRRAQLGRFSTLTELDAVANTGPAFFGRLKLYAEENGFVSSTGPQILSITTDRTSLAPGQSIKIVVFATDEEGFSAIAGGEVLDPVSNFTYGVLRPRLDRSAYEQVFRYEELTARRAPHGVDGSSTETRELHIRFFNRRGGEARSTVRVTLAPCRRETDALCEGRCVSASESTFFVDADGDGLASSTIKRSCSRSPNLVPSSREVCWYDLDLDRNRCEQREVSAGEDCDDTNALLGSKSYWWLDEDGDGFGVAHPSGDPLDMLYSDIYSCYAPQDGRTYAPKSYDCNDRSTTVRPGVEELCGNGIDDDCDNQIDEQCPVLWEHNTTFTGNNRLGATVALSRDGNVLAVAARDAGTDRNGEVSIYRKQGLAWILEKNISPARRDGSIPQRSMRDFGSAMALSTNGEFLAVSNYGNDSMGQVFVYKRDGGVWGEMQYLDTDAWRDFGTSVAFSADASTLVIGSGESDYFTVYTFAANRWVQTAVLQAPLACDVQIDATALSTDGMNFYAGCKYWGSSTGMGRSTLLEFSRSSTQPWTLRSETPIGERTELIRSLSLDQSGSRIAMGIVGYLDRDVGRVEIFDRRASMWTRTTTVSARSGSGAFGHQVSLSSGGDRLLVADHSRGSGTLRGAAHVFVSNGTAWNLERTFDSPDIQGFAMSVAMSGSGSTIAIGEPAISRFWIFER